MWASVQCKSIWSKASCKCWMSGNFGAWQMNRRSGRFNLTKHLNGRRRGFWKIWPDLWMRDKFPAFYPLVKSRGAMGRPPLINRYKCHTLYAQCSMLQMATVPWVCFCRLKRWHFILSRWSFVNSPEQFLFAGKKVEKIHRLHVLQIRTR